MNLSQGTELGRWALQSAFLGLFVVSESVEANGLPELSRRLRLRVGLYVILRKRVIFLVELCRKNKLKHLDVLQCTAEVAQVG